jgi:Spy/CpxP family protein refolding chaperone
MKLAPMMTALRKLLLPAALVGLFTTATFAQKPERPADPPKDPPKDAPKDQPPPREPGGRGPGGPGGGRGMGMPKPGTVLPEFVVTELKLTDEQKKKLEELQKDVDKQLDKLLTEDQKKALKEMADRGPGGFKRRASDFTGGASLSTDRRAPLFIAAAIGLAIGVVTVVLVMIAIR